MSEFEIVARAYEMYQSQYSQVDKLWNYFGVVSLAVAGFTIGNKQATRTIWEPLVIVMGYLAFCVGNYQALSNGHRFLFALAQKYNALDGVAELERVVVHSPDQVARFYVLVLVTFSVAILVVSYSRLYGAKPNNDGHQD